MTRSLPTIADQGPEELGPLMAELVKPYLPAFAQIMHGDIVEVEFDENGNQVSYIAYVEGVAEPVRVFRNLVTGVPVTDILLEVGANVVVLRMPEGQYVLFQAGDAVHLSLFGGTVPLIKTEPLLRELRRMNARLEAALNALTSWTPVPSDGGAALKAAVTAALVGKQEADPDAPDMTNPKVLH